MSCTGCPALETPDFRLTQDRYPAQRLAERVQKSFAHDPIWNVFCPGFAFSQVFTGFYDEKSLCGVFNSGQSRIFPVKGRIIQGAHPSSNLGVYVALIRLRKRVVLPSSLNFRFVISTTAANPPKIHDPRLFDPVDAHTSPPPICLRALPALKPGVPEPPKRLTPIRLGE